MAPQLIGTSNLVQQNISTSITNSIAALPTSPTEDAASPSTEGWHWYHYAATVITGVFILTFALSLVVKIVRGRGKRRKERLDREAMVKSVLVINEKVEEENKRARPPQ